VIAFDLLVYKTMLFQKITNEKTPNMYSMVIVKYWDLEVWDLEVWDLEVWDLGPNGLYLLFGLALNTYLRELAYCDTSAHDL